MQVESDSSTRPGLVHSRQPGQPPGIASIDGGELAEAEVPHVPQHDVAAPDLHDEFTADGLVLGGGGDA